MKPALETFTGALDKALTDAIAGGATPLEVFEEGFGKIVNGALQKGVSPANLVFECKTCEYQLVNMAIARSKQTQTVIEAINALPPGQILDLSKLTR